MTDAAAAQEPESKPKPLPAMSAAFIALIVKLFTRGTSAFIQIFGRRETGKTDMAFLICEILFDAGVIEHFATNTRIYHSRFPIERITSLEELERWSEETKGRKLFVFDEMGKAMSRRRPMASINLNIIDKLQVLRKHKLSIIGIAPADKYVDSISLGSDVLDAIFEKPNYKNPKVALYQDLLDESWQTIVDIPATSVDFDEWDVAPLTERSAGKLPKFKDEDLEKLWKWSHGATAKDLGLFPMQINRLVRKFVKDALEHKYNA